MRSEFQRLARMPSAYASIRRPTTGKAPSALGVFRLAFATILRLAWNEGPKVRLVRYLPSAYPLAPGGLKVAPTVRHGNTLALSQGFFRLPRATREQEARMENLDDPIRMPAPDRPNILKPRADGKASQALVWWSLVVLAIVVAFGAILYEIEKP